MPERKQDQPRGKHVSCGLVKADGYQLGAFARIQAPYSISSGESEFYALTVIACEIVPFKAFLEWLGFRVIWSVRADSSAARSMALREGVGRVRHLDVRSLWTQRAAKTMGLKVKKQDGKTNAADLGTQRHNNTEHEHVMSPRRVGQLECYR